MTKLRQARTLLGMSTQATGAGVVPEFTLYDRLRKAREITGLTSYEFADRIGVSQKTINNAETGRTARPRKILLNAWAMGTGVSLEWLETGKVGAPVDGPGAMSDGEITARYYTGGRDIPRSDELAAA